MEVNMTERVGLICVYMCILLFIQRDVETSRMK